DLRLPKVGETEDTVYLLAEGSDVLGMARVGIRSINALNPLLANATDTGYAQTAVKGGYGAYQTSLQQINPKCLLDIFVVDSFCRRGLGRVLVDAVLEAEGFGSRPTKVAYYIPSPQFCAFLKKHYDLDLCRGKMASKCLLFDDYFRKEEPVREAPAEQTAKATKVCCDPNDDEPVLEEVPEMAELKGVDPLDAYKAKEELFFTRRTKMFVWNEDEWQDAGAGEVHLLNHTASGRVRLIWQQETSLRVLANHFLVNRAGFCELEKHSKGNDKTWMWTAQERVLQRRFALKFKSNEEATHFKELFDEAKYRSWSAVSEPAEYVLLRKVGVTADKRLNSTHVRILPVGASVQLLEMEYIAQEQRMRARIVTPPGWITVLSHNPADAGSHAAMRKDLERFSEVVKGK
ncbi:unnamed protein product, partial [Polarella glacialis]